MKKRFRVLSAAAALVMSLIFLPGCFLIPFISIPKKFDVEKESEKIYQEYLDSISDRKDELESGEITIGDITMKLYFEKIGSPDENGYPLYIALRGGGTSSVELADEQFEVMTYYYTSSIPSGIYIVPKCFVASSDEHFMPESFLFYDRIIEDAIAFYNVDPDRVYVTGFSSGGRGVYQVAPRMADRFAAANMSAGYPDDRRVGNLYNLPFCIQMGENDTASDQNLSAAVYDGLLNDAAEEYGGGFVHDTYIHCGGTHNQYWSDIWWDAQYVYTGQEVAKWLEDPSSATETQVNTCAITWLRKYERDPYPQKIVWDTDVSAKLRNSQAFYWLDRDGGLTHSHIVASYSKNTVTIEECDASYGKLKIYLNPEMLDVAEEVKVEIFGESYTVKPILSAEIMKSTLYARGDRNYMFTSEIDISFDPDGNVVEVKAVESTDTDYSRPDDKPLFYWSDSGLLYIDESLFGLSPKEIEEKTGLDLPNTREWEPSGRNQIYTSYSDPCGQTLIFVFEKNECVIILSESEDLASDSERNLGAYANGISCRHSIENKDRDGTAVVRQSYMPRYYNRWDLITI